MEKGSTQSWVSGAVSTLETDEIEEGGKAAECKKLRVGDELVNINGSALYGSRQEALILIKGSYRVLKIIVRRRTVPLIHPHTWHLVKLAEEPSVPGSAGSSDGPLAMQLHPTPFSVLWHSGGDSELSLPLGHLSQHYSTDRSSSVGSMESLENPPSHGYYESQLSPIDPAIFNNKRDSAYSSFSASSNASDYTVSLRPEENSSMDSLLQGFGPSCRFTEVHPHSTSSGPGESNCETAILKSRSLPHRPEAKVRPSSYSYEENKCGPPLPPKRKDSFRATRGLPEVLDKRCVSAPVGVSPLTIEDPPEIHKSLNGSLNSQETEQDLKENKAEPYYTINPQTDLFIDNPISSTEGCQKNSHFQSLESHSTRPSPAAEESLNSQLNHLENDLQPRMHRHNVPDKLLVSQLHIMELSSNNTAHSMSPSSLWSNPPHPRGELIEDIPDVAQDKWGGSRCSTPGSLTTSELEEHGVDGESFDSGQRLTPVQHTWGRSVSVPGETIGNGFDGSGSCIDSQLQERGFKTISAATSMDTLLENQEEGECKADGDSSKTSQKRQFRSSKSRRRSERFATNLRNEIQRKKAQLQKSKAPVGLLCDGETVEEEDMEEKSPSEVPAIHQHRSQTQTSQYNSFQNFPPSQARPIDSNSAFPGRCCGTNSAEHSKSRTEDIHLSQDESHGIQSAETNRPVCVRVVEELAPPGKARRWRWTPEHKLQPEIESTETKKNSQGTAPSSWNLVTTRGRVGSSVGRSTRADDCDIPPFADRRKFFEETSRNLSQSVTNLEGLTCIRQRPEKHGRKKGLTSPEPLESVPDLGRRRLSYQGGLNDGTSVNLFDARRKNVQQERDRATENTLEREWEKEIEKQREKEREQEMYTEQEKLHAWEKEHERERERERKETERDQQRVQQMERDWETSRDRFHAGHGVNKITVLPPLPQDSLKQPLMAQNITLRNSHSDSFHNKTNTDIQKPHSAFRPVTSQQCHSDHYHLRPGFKARSCTPTEAFPGHELEQTKLRRKFSLTERDYTQCRRDSRPGEVIAGRGFQCQWNNRLCSFNNEDQPIMSSTLTNRTMSENDIRVETKCVRSLGAAATNNSRMSSSLVMELDENVSLVETKKKKGPPPPRPPPPKWEQFHKRRASHHSLFSSQTASSSQLQTYTPCPSTAQEMTRQRSYSLPPREDTENHQSVLNPPLNNRAFKPVALPPKERDNIRNQHFDTKCSGDTPTSSNESSQRLSEQSIAQPSDQYRPAVVKPVIYKHRAEWDLTSPHNYTVSNIVSMSSVPVPTLENGRCSGPVNPESYFTMNHNNEQHLQNELQQICMPGTTIKTLEPSTQSINPSNHQALPYETDIDEFRENEGTSVEQQRPAEHRTEMQCFAQPVTVLETDIDTVTEEEAPSSGMRRGQRASIVDSLMEEDCGRAGKELMGELFPHYAGSGAESWRGGNIVSGDLIERSSRQSPSLPHSELRQGSSSTSHRGSTNKAQLLNKMPNFMEIKEEDEELNYKRQLMESLRKKLAVLHEAQRGLQEDIRANAQLGEEVESLVLAVCKPNEVDKFRMFIGDLDKVTSLLLSLSGRLLRVESALDCLDPESGHRERLPLLDKKKQLLAQLAEAQELKEHVDRREEAVGRVLSRCLTPEQLRDYSHFVKMKAALLVEQRQLDDKIRLGEEQLRGLKESLGLGYGPY
ncbi:protein Shroom4 isoform X2 [Tachysurus fulvidraco]|uniref:protein Shroom4 isoform X2 n=1 Tax=Tachysurus fulvidraco TaxID=1234273 RepID=UPI001FEDC91C|nr:protein Shroom4 isoform X2 [Tachysurus fulvidraco]